MATVLAPSGVEQIGETAGAVWQLLSQTGPIPMTKIAKQIDAPKYLVMQAIGWLAREDKLIIEEEGRRKIVSLG